MKINSEFLYRYEITEYNKMQYFQQVTLPIVLVLLAAVVTSVFGQSSRVAQDDLTLTQRQIQALEKVCRVAIIFRNLTEIS